MAATIEAPHDVQDVSILLIADYISSRACAALPRHRVLTICRIDHANLGFWLTSDASYYEKTAGT